MLLYRYVGHNLCHTRNFEIWTLITWSTAGVSLLHERLWAVEFKVFYSFFCGAEPNFKFEKKCSEYERAGRVKAIAQNFNRRR